MLEGEVYYDHPYLTAAGMNPPVLHVELMNTPVVDQSAGEKLKDYLCSAMGQTMARFEGIRSQFRERRNGGIGAFTPDNVPIFDWVLPNVYMLADSNHGFKMLGAGKLAARYLLGDDVPELKPFALNRFEEGRTFGSNNSHSPWSKYLPNANYQYGLFENIFLHKCVHNFAIKRACCGYVII